MITRVQYHNNVYDMISDVTLQRGIDSGKIKMFYRYSEKRWITIGVDPIRKSAQILAPYAGPERRAAQTFEAPSLTGRDRIPVKNYGVNVISTHLVELV